MLNQMEIVFPHLGLDLKYVPKSFRVFGIEIAMYGIFIALGVICGYLLAEKVAKKQGIDGDFFFDFTIWAVVLSILGARVYYVIFQWDYYKNHLLSILNFREGGLAIYGGVIVAFTTLFVYCNKKKQNPKRVGDAAVCGLILGQIIGRWGNFTNREVFGQYTDSLFAMRIPADMVRNVDISPSIMEHMVEGTNYIQVHPTFLYEGLWNLCILLFMLYWMNKKKFDGEICLIYLGGYGLGRAWIEQIRTDQLYIHGTTVPVSQVLAIVLFVGAVVCDIVVRIHIGKNNKE